jgi:holin-like protein
MERVKIVWRIFWQSALLLGFSLAGREIAAVLHVKIPGSIIGLALLFLLLQFRVVRVEWIEAGASWLISEMILFFVPAAVGAVQYKALIAAEGWKLLVVLIIGTIVVMGFTGWVAERVGRMQGRKEVPEHGTGSR